MISDLFTKEYTEFHRFFSYCHPERSEGSRKHKVDIKCMHSDSSLHFVRSDELMRAYPNNDKKENWERNLKNSVRLRETLW